METNTKCAVGYARLSSRSATEDARSIERQKAVVAEWCERHGYRLTSVYTDVKVSGRRASREGLDRAIGEAALRGCMLVVSELDRLIRDQRVLIRLRDEKIGFRALDCPEASELQIDMMVLLSSYYSRIVSAKMKKYHASRKEQVSQGIEIPHPVPKPDPRPEAYGKSLPKARAKHEAKARIRNQYVLNEIDSFLAKHGTQMSFGAIAKRLNEEGFQTSRGGQWTYTGVQRIMNRYKPVSPSTRPE